MDRVIETDREVMKEIELRFEFKGEQFCLVGYENDFLSKVILNGLVWEQHILEFVIEMSKNNKMPIFDIGANIGYHSVLLDRLCKDKELIAIEPHPETLEISNFKIVPYAVDKSMSDLSMPPHDGRDSGAMSVQSAAGKIKSLTVDMLTAKFGIPDIVKIDIQGYEPNAIIGSKETIKEKKTTFILEFYPRDVKKFGLDFKLTFEKFISCDYRIGFFRPHPLFCIEEITPSICEQFFKLWEKKGGTLDLVFMPR